jgi:hypothetical protein
LQPETGGTYKNVARNDILYKVLLLKLASYLSKGPVNTIPGQEHCESLQAIGAATFKGYSARIP